jgi:hypothetical protein
LKKKNTALGLIICSLLQTSFIIADSDSDSSFASAVAAIINLLFYSPEDRYIRSDSGLVPHDEFCRQLQVDLRGLNNAAISDIISRVKTKLFCSTQPTTEQAKQYAHDSVVEYYKEHAYKIAISEGASFDYAERRAESEAGNVNARLKQSKYINSDALFQFNHPSFEEKIRQDVRALKGYHHPQPATSHSAPQYQVPTPFDINAFYEQVRRGLRKYNIDNTNVENLIQRTRQKVANHSANYWEAASPEQALRYFHESFIENRGEFTKKEALNNGALADYAERRAKSTRENISAELKKVKELSPHLLAKYFGHKFEEGIKKDVIRENTSQQYTQPQPTPQYHSYVATPPVPAQPTISTAPVGGTPADVYRVTTMVDDHGEILQKAGISDQNMRKYKDSFWKHCAKYTFSDDQLRQCSKARIRDMLRGSIDEQGLKLQHKVHNKIALEEAIEDVKRYIEQSVPDNGSPLNMNNLKKYGSQLYASGPFTNLENSILEQTNGVNCSICDEQFKDQVVGGQGGVRLPLPGCNAHPVCSHCALNMTQGTCPECRAPFNLNVFKEHAKQF